MIFIKLEIYSFGSGWAEGCSSTISRGGGTQTGQSRDFLYICLCNWTIVF